MNFLPVLQPFHLRVWIGDLDGQFDLMAFCHLVRRIQLLQEGCVSESSAFLLAAHCSALTRARCAQTGAFLLLFLHLLQPLQHASQVGDAVLKSNFLIFRGGSLAEDIPYVHFGL